MPVNSELENKIRDNCEYLLFKLIALKTIYQDERFIGKRDLIETGIGADIFYISQSFVPFWTGKISTSLIQHFHPNNKNFKNLYRGTKEHDYSRKLSAKELINSKWLNEKSNLNKFVELFKHKYGRWNLVTQDENSKLKKHYKNYNNPKYNYIKAGVILKKVSNEERLQILKRNQNLIESFI